MPGHRAHGPMIGRMATAARRMPNSAFINQLCILAFTVRRRHTGGMNASKRMNSWSACTAANGESTSGANMNGGITNGGNTIAITMSIATIATETVMKIVTGTAANLLQ